MQEKLENYYFLVCHVRKSAKKKANGTFHALSTRLFLHFSNFLLWNDETLVAQAVAAAAERSHPNWAILDTNYVWLDRQFSTNNTET